ncbi:MAG: MFS transporter [Paracoccaceae bacterium]
MALPRGVVALGLVSLCMDMSSEAVHAILPLYLIGTLGASALMLGLIEGLGEATAQITKLVSGLRSDRSGRRKPLVLLGYGLGGLTKPLFALAVGPGLVLAARLIDRIGKGIRGAPRDALLADIVPDGQRGAAFGLRQSMDTLGAILGPALALAVMALGGTPRMVFVLAVVPAMAAVAVLALGVQEPARRAPPKQPPRLTRAALRAMGPAFWATVTAGAVLTLARVSEAFLILRASDLGLSITWAPLVLILFNIVYAASAWPAGILSDRIGRRGLMLAGFGMLVLADLILALGQGPVAVALGIALWGLHMGLTQGTLSAEVARHAPEDMRATAFGLFNLVTGLALLTGNAGAGALWLWGGAAAAFGAGAALALCGLCLILRR